MAALSTAGASSSSSFHYRSFGSPSVPPGLLLLPKSRSHGSQIGPSALKTVKLHFGLRPVRKPIRAVTREESSDDTSKSFPEVIGDLKEKWDSIEKKSTLLLYVGGTLAALWVSSTIISAINSVPLLPKLMELIGLGYTSWFTYRYLLFKENRKELVDDIEELKKKITGSEDD